jgi:phosphatidylinositol glycan class W
MSRAAEAAMAASYKALKEDFVSNLTGGEIGEINYVTAVAPVSSPLSIAERANFWKGSSCSLVSTTVATVLI